MADLIYRKELRDALYEADAVTMQGVKIINQFPAVDAVPVVRCRDCIGHSTWYNDAEYGCAVCGMSGMYPKSENGYCSYGLRRSDE